MNCPIEEEIELLKQIYVNEMTVELDKSGQHCIQLLLHPATAEDTKKQYVCLTLNITLPTKYPEIVPCVTISQPRGLGEAHISELRCQLHDFAEKKVGEAMLFDIIELTKESLTESNMPHGICAVCQETFSDKEDFIRTECYHYFHTQCFYRYIKHELDSARQEDAGLHYSQQVERMQKQIVCPVCRVQIVFDLDAVLAFQPIKCEDFSYTPDSDMLQWQCQMKALLAKQKAKGGVIDLDEQKMKFLLPSNP